MKGASKNSRKGNPTIDSKKKSVTTGSSVSKDPITNPWKPSELQISVFLTFILGLHALLIYIYNFNFNYYNIADRDWGYDNILYMPAWVQILFYAFSLMAIWLGYFFRLSDNIKQSLENIKAPWYISVITAITLIPVSYWLFKSFKIKYFFLGDMNLRIAQTINKQFIKTEYLTMWLLHYLHSKLGDKYKLSMEDIFAQTGYISGALFVLCAYFISITLFRSLLHRLLSFLIILSGGYLLVFFGYLEIYALPSLFIIIFLLSGILSLTGRLHFIFPVLAFVLAISFHGFSLIFFPALVYILYKKTPLGNLPIHSIPRWIYFIVGVIAIASFYLLGPLFDFGFFLPLKDELNNKRMLLFSVTHLWEFLNAIILGGGGTFILLLMIFPFVVMNKDENKPVSNFLMLASFFSIGFVFTLDAMRGSGDWDLFAIALIPANILVPYFLINGQTFISKRGVYILLFSGLIFNAFNTSAWININHTDKSISKIKKMLVHDPGSYYVNSFQSEPGLALNFKFNGLMDEAFEMHELAYRKYGNTCGKCVYNYGYDLINNKRTEEGVAILEYVVSTFPFYPYSYLALINHYASVKDNANAFRIALLLFNNYKKNNTEFDKNIKKDELKNIFSNLYNYEIYRGNTSKALEISAVLSKLNAGQ